MGNRRKKYTARARERAFKAHSRRPDARHHNATGHQLKKLVKPEVRRTAAAYLIATYTVAAVRACGLIGISRSAFAYRKKSRSEALREQIKELAKEHYRWGYRLLFNYLRRLGETLNHKKFLRIYRQEHLQIGKRSPSQGTPIRPSKKRKRNKRNMEHGLYVRRIGEQEELSDTEHNR